MSLNYLALADLELNFSNLPLNFQLSPAYAFQGAGITDACMQPCMPPVSMFYSLILVA